VGSWPEHVAAWYGALAAGAIAVDVNYIVQDEEWRNVLLDSAPAALIGAAPFLSRLEPLARDLGDLPVTVAVGPLPDGAIGEALDRGATEARRLRLCGLIEGAAISLCGQWRLETGGTVLAQVRTG